MPATLAAAFALGLKTVRESGRDLLHLLFGVRARVVTGEMVKADA